MICSKWAKIYCYKLHHTPSFFFSQPSFFNLMSYYFVGEGSYVLHVMHVIKKSIFRDFSCSFFKIAHILFTQYNVYIYIYIYIYIYTLFNFLCTCKCLICLRRRKLGIPADIKLATLACPDTFCHNFVHKPRCYFIKYHFSPTHKLLPHCFDDSMRLQNV